MYRLTITTSLLLILSDRWIFFLLLYAVHVMYTISSTLVEQGRVSICSPSIHFDSLWIGNATACFIICYGLPLIGWITCLLKYEIMINYGSYSHDNENEFGGSHVKILFLTSMEAASAARSLVGTKTCCFRQLFYLPSVNNLIRRINKWWPISRKTPNQWSIGLAFTS